MTQGPNVSMGGGSFDFDRENSGPSDPQRPSGPQRPGGGSGRKPRRIGCGTIIFFVVILIVIGNMFRGCGSSGSSANCGDYDLSDGQYVSNPGEGDYEKNGSSYDYVGCDSSRSGGGGFFFLPFFTGGGSNYGDGSGFRGGGPGTGK